MKLVRGGVDINQLCLSVLLLELVGYLVRGLSLEELRELLSGEHWLRLRIGLNDRGALC